MNQDVQARLSELQERRTGLASEAREIHDRAGDRELSSGEQERFDRLQRGIEKIDDERRDLIGQLASGNPARLENGDGATGAPEFMRRVDPFDAHAGTLSRTQARDRALKLLERAEHVDVPDAGKEHLEKLLRAQVTQEQPNTDGGYISKRLLITEHPHYRSAFQRAMLPRPLFTNEETMALRALDELEREYRAMGIGTDASGGFGVPVLIDPTIMISSAMEDADLAEFFEISRVEVITTDEWKGVSSAGITWSFDAEAAEVSDDSPTLAQPTVPVHTARGFVPYSIEVEMDYPRFADEMTGLLTVGYRDLAAEKLTVGSGSGEPTGIVTALDANTTVEVTPTTDGAFGAVDVYKIWDALPRRFRRRASWMSSVDVQNEIRQFGTTLGSNFTVGLLQEKIEKLFNKRYVVNDEMADFTGTTGAANLLIVGSFENFLIASRAGMRVETVQHLVGTNRRPTGQRGLFAWARIGSDSVVDNAFRILQNQ